jgi:type I restriction enzyme M protein
MNNDAFKGIEEFESDLWEAADNLRANSKLTSSDYFMPVLGVIFLRHASNRFQAANVQIAADQASGKMPRRKVRPADYIARRSLYLPERARYDWIMAQAAVSSADLPKLVTEAMAAIEADFPPLLGVLPKDYGIFETKVLEDLMRLFNSDQIKQATGDVFGRIYEYFLAKFSIQKAHDNGEFFTPSSIVQTIVNVIEPDHGSVFDPACGSGGMFVQSSHFIEHEGGDTAKKVVFYGQEKNRDTIRIAKMNLAVHGLEGKIAEAITYYQDEHSLVGRCDFVMANPPFNVDLVDAERIKGDPRLPFGLPGVNKQKKVGNANYLWISYFWSYLSAKGRAGFVMSSQASSAGHGEKEVRQKLVETGDVDVMISIRSNFFYTRAVPCELWHFDRSKAPARKDKVLMLDARNIYRKVTRKIYDFSPEQMQNLAAIVWLYRGQQNRFLGLVKSYLGRVCAESAAVPASMTPLEGTLSELCGRFDALVKAAEAHANVDLDKKRALGDALAELREAAILYEADANEVLASLKAFDRRYAKALPDNNKSQRAVRTAFDPIAEAIRGLVKQVDLLYKLAARVANFGTDLAMDAISHAYDRRATGRLIKQFDEERKVSVEQLKRAAYFHRQVAWLQDRFPKAELEAVPGLVKVVDRDDIERADWSLTPGRYVGVAPAPEDEDFDFELTLRDIHTELADLNKEASELAMRIQDNFQELGS